MDALLSLVALLVELAFYVCVLSFHALVGIFKFLVYLFEAVFGRAPAPRAPQGPTEPAPPSSRSD